jgi:hypothetical protein
LLHFFIFLEGSCEGAAAAQRQHAQSLECRCGWHVCKQSSHQASHQGQTLDLSRPVQGITMQFDTEKWGGERKKGCGDKRERGLM